MTLTVLLTLSNEDGRSFRNWNITLSNETIVMVWISSADAAAVVEKGCRIIQAPSNYFYLSSGAGEWPNWAYTFDQLANLTEAQYELVLGGEQILWSEQSGPQNIDPIPTGAALNVTEALPRLHDVRYRMVQRGPQWCAFRPDACDIYV
ncbi:hypothetical protein EV424DRAFT_1449016 [Suillus variegatus]|nr:hypothetical protein EV424DRAFT_1449016 [Suillus variegatus]